MWPRYSMCQAVSGVDHQEAVQLGEAATQIPLAVMNLTQGGVALQKALNNVMTEVSKGRSSSMSPRVISDRSAGPSRSPPTGSRWG